MEDQWEYWVGIGILLYLVKHLCLDLANPTAYKELLHVFKYVLNMKKLGLNIKCTGNLNKPWKIMSFSNNDYAVDLESRRSISGFILYILGVPVAWQSKSQKSLSLSSS